MFVKMFVMNKTVGNNLKILRKAKSMSQEQVADHLKISQSAYARMERGESTSWATHFDRICQVFEITPEELVRKETAAESYEWLVNSNQRTEQLMLSVYQEILKKYELQIEDLKTIVNHLKEGLNKKGFTAK